MGTPYPSAARMPCSERRAGRMALGALVVACAATTAHAAPEKVAPGHPIVGKWAWTRPNGCPESFDYRANGTLGIVSGDEVTENRYTIDRAPGETRFYAMRIRTVKDNGKPDCDGDAKDDTGTENTVYIFINAQRDAHVTCRTEAFDTCFGPLTRQAR